MAGRLYTIDEAGRDFLKAGRTTVFGLIRDGELRAIKVGRLTRIPESELQQFVERKLVEQGEAVRA